MTGVLPLNFEMLLGYGLSGWLSIGRFLLFARKSSLETCKLLFSFAVVSWILNRGSLGVGQEAFETDIYTQWLAIGDMFDFALSLHAELSSVSISPARDAYQQHDALSQSIGREEQQPGALIFFGREQITHVALALNKHEYIHAEGQNYNRVTVHSLDPHHPAYN